VGRNFNFIARTAGAPATLASALRMAVRSIDKSLPVSEMQTLEEMVDRSTAPRKFGTYLVTLFAAIALLLAGVGVYGVMAYSVTMRTQEIGIRMALGATRREVLRMVVAQALSILGVGIAIGLAGALVLTRLIAGLLYETKPSDPLTLSAVSLCIAASALAATCFPAFRATRVDPMIALRYE
jgi:putative ABC transport system permease protein